MKLCPSCNQSLSEDVITCPACGAGVGEGRKYLDDYRIISFIHEGYGSILYRAIKEGEKKPTAIRLFKPESGLNENVAKRLKGELEELKKLPKDIFVQHFEIKKSSDGLWYRVSEWVNTLNWGDLIASGYFSNYASAFRLFSRIASSLEELHKNGHFIPHLILKDILIYKSNNEDMEVKLDFKLSRFIDPELSQPCPMLQNLINRHPDMRNRRPLDFKSDIWSLGKIFVELLSMKKEVEDYGKELNDLPLPKEAKVLIGQMIVDDPELRLASMTGVGEKFKVLTNKVNSEIKEDCSAAGALSEVKSIKRNFWVLTVLVLFLFVGGIGLQLQYGFFSKDDTKTIASYAKQYRDSVAYVVTEYWVTINGERVYRKIAEGTAFLVDAEGYIVTNRHVVCPWLNDASLDETMQGLIESGKQPKFGYRTLLWFEGQKAFYRHGEFSEDAELSEIYDLDSAYKSNDFPKLKIVGVAFPPTTKREFIKSPLEDDIAVLMVETVPKDLKPIPLYNVKSERSSKLESVVVIGFPHGRREIPDNYVSASETMGHIRRNFKNSIQIDASLHPGNSGGPVINLKGKAIGIASQIAVKESVGVFSSYNQLFTDFGKVLPIQGAVSLLQQLKNGKVKWKGVRDYSLDSKIQNIAELARNSLWDTSSSKVDEYIKLNENLKVDPAFNLFAGVIYFCNDEINKAKSTFERALSINPENAFANLMLFIIDWKEGNALESEYGVELKVLDWMSSSEFYGYLAKVLAGEIPEHLVFQGWENAMEKSLIYYVLGLMEMKSGDNAKAEAHLREALLGLYEDNWEYLLVKAGLEEVQNIRDSSFRDVNLREHYLLDKESFWKKYKLSINAKKAKKMKMNKLLGLLTNDVETNEKLVIYQDLIELEPEYKGFLVGLVFQEAMEEDWKSALKYSDEFLEQEGRESANRLGIELFRSQILYKLGEKENALNSLRAYLNNIKDPWYQNIVRILLEKEHQKTLIGKAWENPEKQLTLFMALGFKAEADGENEIAVKYYVNALESLLDNWLEYEFAKARIQELK